MCVLGQQNFCSEALEGIQELLWPTRCVGCDMPGELLCGDCREHMPWIGQRWACPVCGAPFGWLTCTECKRDWELATTVCCLPFFGVAARMITCYKDEGERRMAPVIAAAMLTSLDEASAWPRVDGLPRFDAAALDGVCFVPATAEAYTRRGFDHMELVASHFSAATGIPLVDVLARRSARDQRELGRAERALNLAGSVDVVDDVRGLNLLLLDDVITTGATVREAARALLQRGAGEVSACALARVW